METTPDTFKTKMIGFVNLVFTLTLLPIGTSGSTSLTNRLVQELHQSGQRWLRSSPKYIKVNWGSGSQM